MQPAGAQPRQHELGQRERGEDVDLVEAAQLVERIVRERRQGGRAEAARVVDQQVELRAGGLEQARAVLGVGDVARDGGDAREVRDRVSQRRFVAAVDDELPAPLGERPRQSQPEAARRPGDDAPHAATVGKP